MHNIISAVCLNAESERKSYMLQEKHAGSLIVVRYTRRWGILPGDEASDGVVESRMGEMPPSSIVGWPPTSPGSVSSTPSAVPIRAPAAATWSMGAFLRFWYPDLTRLFETDSLDK
jgi:hypothetical protein